ncbi:MAG: PAS domain-containing protein, partial [Halanaeroarchaeum sp.]
MSGERPPIRVLHVDDDPDLADLAKSFLEREDDRIEVTTAQSANEVIEQVPAVDCVVSDFEMPGMDGIEFLERVREDHPDLPFILYTGKGSEDVASDAIAAGVTDYLQKETGTGHYALLANRITNAVDQYRTTHRAETLDQIRRVVRDVNQVLIRARSRQELESRVVEILSGARPYAFVWIGEPDPDADVVSPRVKAGAGEGYLQSVDVTLGDGPTANGPTAQAVHEGELVVTQSIPDADDEPWREAALERGFRSSAAVPIHFEDTVYGVLNVYTDEEGAFDATERDLLVELGDDIGHAIHRIESEQQYKQLFDRFPEPTVAVTFVDGEPVLDAVNPAFESVFGFDREEAVGESANRLIVPEEKLDEAKDIDERSRRDDLIDQEVRRQTADGVQTFLLRNIPIEGTTGPDLYWVYVDITERIQQKKALEALAERLELALEAGQFGVWDWNVQTGAVAFSDRWAEMLGFDPSAIEPTIEAWKRRVHPDDLESVNSALDEHFAGETEYYDCEHRVRSKSGDWRWIRDIGKVVERTDDGDPRRAVGIHQDVTERRERREALRRERERFESLFEFFPASVVAVTYEDDEPIIRDANSTFEEVFGHDVDRVTGESLNDLIVPEQRRTEAQSLDERLQNRDLVDHEVRRTAVDGERHFVLRTITLSEEHELHTYAVYIDVTDRIDRERAMAALHEAATELESAATTDQVYDATIDAAEDILDFALIAIDVHEDGALVQRAWSLDRDTDSYYSRTPLEEDTLATRAYRTGETILVEDLAESDLTPADSEYRSALTVPMGAIGTFQTVSRTVGAFDETDRELAELLVGHTMEALRRLENAESLRSQRERLRHENERLDTFVYILSHDIRNPITVAEGRIDLARDECESDDLEVAANSLDRMSEMVEEVLTWAREGRHVPDDERRPVELARLADACWKNVQTSDATVDVRTDRTISADESRLQHVFENLFRNAVEHSSTSP